MTGRRRVVVLWDVAQVPPAGPLLDAAALATPEWDWSYVGPETPVRPPTMVLHGRRAEPVLDCVDVVVGVPSAWTLEQVVASGARFVAIVLGDTVLDAGSGELAVDGWPSAERWPLVLGAAVSLDDGHHRAVAESSDAREVADGIRDLLDEIRARHLPEGFGPQS